MRRLRRPLHHPLAKAFFRSVESLTTSLGDASLRDYLATIRRFLDYLGANYPEVRRLEQLRRDPHILGWLAQLRSHTPPLAKNHSCQSCHPLAPHAGRPGVDRTTPGTGSSVDL
jgi:hypothetical protein